ncbi:hypothetical protein N9O56_00575 [Rickettsiales bacterium]|nr:hypothetical protein [Rickettsiales bacterium]
MPRDAKKYSSDLYNDDLITLEQYIHNSLLRDGNLTNTISKLKQEAEQLKKSIDWNRAESIEQYVDQLYSLDNLGFEEFVCDKFMEFYDKCIEERDMKKIILKFY